MVNLKLRGENKQVRGLIIGNCTYTRLFLFLNLHWVSTQLGGKPGDTSRGTGLRRRWAASGQVGTLSPDSLLMQSQSLELLRDGAGKAHCISGGG